MLTSSTDELLEEIAAGGGSPRSVSDLILTATQVLGIGETQGGAREMLARRKPRLERVFAGSLLDARVVSERGGDRLDFDWFGLDADRETVLAHRIAAKIGYGVEEVAFRPTAHARLPRATADKMFLDADPFDARDQVASAMRKALAHAAMAGVGRRLPIPAPKARGRFEVENLATGASARDPRRAEFLDFHPAFRRDVPQKAYESDFPKATDDAVDRAEAQPTSGADQTSSRHAGSSHAGRPGAGKPRLSQDRLQALASNPATRKLFGIGTGAAV